MSRSEVRVCLIVRWTTTRSPAARSRRTRSRAMCFWRGVRNLTRSGNSIRKKGAIMPTTMVTMPSMIWSGAIFHVS